MKPMHGHDNTVEMLLLKLAPFSLLFLIACPGPQTVDVGNPDIACQAGQTQICSCNINQMGERVCNGQGFYGECICSNTDPNNNNPDYNPPNNFDGGPTDTTPDPTRCVDEDGDGFYTCIPDNVDAGSIPDEVDCNDNVWHVQPGGAEVPGNRIDDNCNGVIDEIEDGCLCYSSNAQSSGAMASAIGLCGERLISSGTTGDIKQRNTQAGYFGIAPRAGGCFSILSTGKAVPANTMGNVNTDNVLYFTSNDSNAAFECQLDGGAWVTCTSPYDIASFNTGVHQLLIRAIDASGNKDPMPILYRWNAATNEVLPSDLSGNPPILLSPPLSLSYPTNNTTLKDNTPYIGGYGPQEANVQVTLTNTANDYSFTLETGVSMNGRWVIDDTLWNGQILNDAQTYTIDVATDDGSTLSSIEISIDAAATEPIYTDATVLLVEDSGGSGAVLTFIATDAQAGFECRMNNNAWQPCTSPFTFNDVGSDVNTFEVRAILNGAAEPVPDGFIWQAVATDFSLLSPADGATTSEELPAFIGRGMPGFSVQMILQKMTGNTVAQEWVQSTAVGIDGRWTFLAPTSLSSGTYQVSYSMPGLVDTPNIHSFEHDASATDTFAPATFIGGHSAVQPGFSFPGATSADPDPNDTTNDFVHDLTNLRLEIKKPSNVSGFAFDFMFLSSEFPEFLCQIFNDTFYALAQIDSLSSSYTNVSFDSDGNEITVNNAFFEPANNWTSPLHLTPFGIQGAGQCPPNDPLADLIGGIIGGTDGACTLPDYCSDPAAVSTIGSGTGWLTTTVPLAETDDIINLHFSVHDEGDGNLDSLVLIDNFRWLVEAVDVGTEKPPELIADP